MFPLDRWEMEQAFNCEKIIYLITGHSENVFPRDSSAAVDDMMLGTCNLL
jgi:hypothetical protein